MRGDSQPERTIAGRVARYVGVGMLLASAAVLGDQIYGAIGTEDQVYCVGFPCESGVGTVLQDVLPTAGAIYGLGSAGVALVLEAETIGAWFRARQADEPPRDGRAGN